MSDIHISHLAKLSKLTLTTAEEELFETQANETVDYIKNLNDLNTDNVLPTSSVTGTTNRYRGDLMSSERRLSPKIFKVTRIM
ncbi:MAG: Asp-tRNA(Asn)/Glu-tRNA(Gln) amidotransferase subunit GatC [bacterium]